LESNAETPVVASLTPSYEHCGACSMGQSRREGAGPSLKTKQGRKRPFVRVGFLIGHRADAPPTGERSQLGPNASESRWNKSGPGSRPAGLHKSIEYLASVRLIHVRQLVLTA
tara:strand:+ start:126 stop:464 length:339 start_codon:yes stop_codon:yes gene_type:complete